MPSAKDNAIGLYMTGIRDGRPAEAVAAHTGTRYRQHSTGVADGQDGFVAFFKQFLERNPVRDIRIVRALQDGDKVFVQAHQSLNDGDAEWVTGDFFDSDGSGKIIEHWDVISAMAQKNAAGHSLIDGPYEVADHDATDKNRELVRDFVQTCLVGGKFDRVDAFVDRMSYIGHSQDATDEVDALATGTSGDLGQLSYQECFLIVAEGNFVATLNRARREECDQCHVDLFRVDQGRIVEHWDLSEPVPPVSEWVNSGKF